MAPPKNAITITELVLLILVWSACQTAWRGVVIEGLNSAATRLVPTLDRFYQSVLVGAVLLMVLYAMILLSTNVNIGYFKIFELAPTETRSR